MHARKGKQRKRVMLKEKKNPSSKRKPTMEGNKNPPDGSKRKGNRNNVGKYNTLLPAMIIF